MLSCIRSGLEQGMPDQLSTKEPVLVFIHLPKTGGTTLNHIFFGKFPYKKIFQILNALDCETFLQMSDEKRNEFDCIMGHVPACIHNFISRPCRYIILLREPLERAISDYYFILTDTRHPRHERYNREKVTLEEHLREERGLYPGYHKTPALSRSGSSSRYTGNKKMARF